MRAADRTLIEWLGEDGLATILRYSLNKASLVRLANARRVNIPGMRNQSVPADRLATALAAKFAKEEASRRTLLSALDTANRRFLEEWHGCSEEEARTRVLDEKASGAAAARVLYAMSRDKREGLGAEAAQALLSRLRGAGPRDETPAETAVQRLGEAQKEKEDLLEQLAAREQTIGKLRARQQRLEKEVAQRKFDLNNLRLQLNRGKQEQERVEKELRVLLQKLDESTSRRKGSLPEDVSPKLAQVHEQGRKIIAQLEKLSGRFQREQKAGDKVAQAGKSIDELKRQLSETRRSLKEERETTSSELAGISHGLAALREELSALRAAASARPASKTKAEKARGGRPRVGLFVDVQNVFYGARQQNARLDFEALLETVTRGRRLIRASAYVVESRDINQAGFISLLQQKGYEVKRKPLKVRADGSWKGDWDMAIALDILDTCETLDVVVLVTGDGDFTSLVHRVKARGVEVDIYSFPRNTAKELREIASRFVPIDRRLLIKLPKEAATEKKKAPQGAASS
jgi:uncharacterized LabA/DUF88 family protein